MDELELAQGTAYSYVNRLVDAGVVKVAHDEQPRRYAAREIDLTVTTAAGDREYTITPALIDAVARERGEVTHRLMVKDLDISLLAAKIVLQALRPVVHKHYDIDESGASLNGLDIDDGDAADNA